MPRTNGRKRVRSAGGEVKKAWKGSFDLRVKTTDGLGGGNENEPNVDERVRGF